MQTTIPQTMDDWSISRFSRLGELLQAERDADGRPVFAVTMRDRDPPSSPDSVLSTLDESDFDELWLFAVDVGNGLAVEDCEAISRFRAKGRGLFVTRDHMDLGSSVCTLGGVGKAHFFHSRSQDPDARNCVADDPYTTTISWPNYHSGANGNYQEITVVQPVHPVLADPSSPTGAIRLLPSHPHEGAVGAPADEQARIIATGVSKVTGRLFNISVAFDPSHSRGPAIAQSTFHHFADYNWDPRSGAPSFVTEEPGGLMVSTPAAIADTQRFALNIAYWLGRKPRS